MLAVGTAVRAVGTAVRTAAESSAPASITAAATLPRSTCTSSVLAYSCSRDSP